MLGGVQVEHELAERTLEPREVAGQHGEARAGELRGALEIHHAERFANLEMLLRGIGAARLADAAELDIVLFVGADRNVIQRDVGKHGQRVVQRAVELALARLAILDELLDGADLGLQFLGTRRVAGAHRIADLLRGGVAALLLLLQLGQMGAARLVTGDDLLDGPRRIALVPTALLERGFERLRVVANPSDVEHGGGISLGSVRAGKRRGRKPQRGPTQAARRGYYPAASAPASSASRARRSSSRLRSTMRASQIEIS